MSDYTTSSNQPQYPGSSGTQLLQPQHLEYALPHPLHVSQIIPAPSGAGGYFCSGQGSGAAALPMSTGRRGSLPLHGHVASIENPPDRCGHQTSTPSPGHTAGHHSNNNNDGNPVDQAAATGLGALPPKPIRRRMRMITSCLECRRRKLKCNRTQPCLNCQKFSRECTYLGAKLDEVSQLRLTEMKEKVGSLERDFEQVVVKAATRAGSHELGPGAEGGRRNTIIADDVNDELDEEGDLEPSPLVAADLTYEDDAEGTDDIIDLGIRIGKMRITERIGGMNRPRLAEEILAGLESSGQGETVQMLLQQQQDMISALGPHIDPAAGQMPDFLRPSGSYIAPSSGFFFGHILQTPSLLSLLPEKEVRLKLVRRYFEAVHPVAPCVHRGSFEALYQSFEDDVGQYMEPRSSVQAVVFAAWFSAAVSVPGEDALGTYGVNINDLVNKLKLGVESSLSKAHFIKTTKVETLQALVMYLVALCRNEVSRAHSILTGAAIRIAQCLGLSRDGEVYGLTPLETHVRRLLWHQLCFLDIRTCEAQGPIPGIRREEYDAKLPLNIDDADLTPNTRGPLAMADRWTLMLLPRIRFEINEMMRMLWSDRRKLEARRLTLAPVLLKIAAFRKTLNDKYGPMLDDSVPIQRYVKYVMTLLLHRLNIMVLHPYHANTTVPMPDKLNRLLVYSGLAMIEISIQLERNPLFREWRWYLGAYHQHQIALLLATEIYYNPEHPLANRIWACIDDVFSLDPNLSRPDKVLAILTEIMTKTGVYASLRKVRAPSASADAVLGRRAPVKSSPPPGNHADNTPLDPLGLLNNNNPAAAAMVGLPPTTQPQTQPQQQQPTYLPLSQQQQQQHIPQLPLPPPPPPFLIPPGMVLGGVSDGEALWALPGNFPNSPDHTSDEESPRGNVVCGIPLQQQQQQQQVMAPMGGMRQHHPQHHHRGLPAQQGHPGQGPAQGHHGGHHGHFGYQGLGHGQQQVHQQGQSMEIDWGQMDLLAQELNFNAMMDGTQQAGGLGGVPW